MQHLTLKLLSIVLIHLSDVLSATAQSNSIVAAAKNIITAKEIRQTILPDTGWVKTGFTPYKYHMGMDTAVKHDGRTAMTIQSDDTSYIFSPEDFGSLKRIISADEYTGKRIRMTGYIKSSNVSSWAGFWLRIDQAGTGNVLLIDNMQDRPVKGTTDWSKYDIVLHVPYDASKIVFGALLTGSGQIWFDDVRLGAE